MTLPGLLWYCTGFADLDRLDDDDRLEEGQTEGGEPLQGFLPAPLHRVQDREEARGQDRQDTHCNEGRYTQVGPA